MSGLTRSPQGLEEERLGLKLALKEGGGKLRQFFLQGRKWQFPLGGEAVGR